MQCTINHIIIIIIILSYYFYWILVCEGRRAIVLSDAVAVVIVAAVLVVATAVAATSGRGRAQCQRWCLLLGFPDLMVALHHLRPIFGLARKPCFRPWMSSSPSMAQ